MRSSVIALGIASVCCVAPGFGCWYSPASACGSLKSTEVVFVGRVMENGGEGYGTGPATLTVDEILHGLPKGTRQVTVDTGAGWDCHLALVKGERYVIFASSEKGNPDRVKADKTTASFIVAGNEKLLAALEQAEVNGQTRLVGKALVKYEELKTATEPAAGLRVTATRDGARLETLTGADGQFEFSNVDPGRYHLDVLSPDFLIDRFPTPQGDLVVEPFGCDHQILEVWPNGRVAGTVHDQAGRPIEGVTVQAFIDRSGQLLISPLREARTTADGRYELGPLPPGEVVVGINAEKYDDRTPWPPTYYPGTSDPDAAEHLQLGRGEKRGGIDLQLSSPRIPATLHVEFVRDDGSPALDGPVARVESLAGVQRAYVSAHAEQPATGLLDIPVYQGETYIVKGSSSDLRKNWSGQSGPVIVDGPDVHVRVVLHVDQRFGK